MLQNKIIPYNHLLSFRQILFSSLTQNIVITFIALLFEARASVLFNDYNDDMNACAFINVFKFKIRVNMIKHLPDFIRNVLKCIIEVISNFLFLEMENVVVISFMCKKYLKKICNINIDLFLYEINLQNTLIVHLQYINYICFHFILSIQISCLFHTFPKPSYKTL